MLKKLFFAKFQSVQTAAIIIGLFSLLSKFLGLARDKILAHSFGAGNILDSYYAAFRLPDLIYNLLILGALTAGFIPVYLEVRQKSKEDSERLASSIFNILLIALGIFALLTIIFAPYLVKIIVPGFSAENRSMTAEMTRIMALSPLFLGISSLFGGILQSRRRFLMFSVAPLLYNGGIIFGALVFVNFFGVYGLALGVVLGAFLHMLAQALVVGKLGFHFDFKKIIAPQIKESANKIFKLMAPRVLGTAVSQFNLFIVTIFASGLSSGSIAVYSFASNLASLPVDLFGVSYAIAVFPSLGEDAARGDLKKIINDVSRAIGRVLFFIVPSTILFLLLRAQIVRVVYGSGRFDWSATIRTADTLAFFVLSMFASALIPLLARVFYALKDTKTPLVAAIVSALINIFFCAAFRGPFGVAGLAAAFSLSVVVNFVLLYGLLKLRLGSLGELSILPSIFKISLSALVMALAVQILKYPLAAILDLQTFLGIFLQGAVAGISGLAIYSALNFFLKTKEIEAVRLRVFPRK
ncbi:MAG: murein biosynthesis integral membrane protein MurJ [Patescibacteria group bacterium]